GLLWLVLGAFALPFLFEATSGCSFKTIPAGEPIDDNAYTCACNCDESRIVSIAVAASSDDAEQATGNMFLTNPNLNLAAIPAGLRFPAVTIPQGAVIQSAFVQFTADANNTEASTMQVGAQAWRSSRPKRPPSILRPTMGVAGPRRSPRSPGPRGRGSPAAPARISARRT